MSATLGQNRVFDRATLEEVLHEGVIYMKAAVACTKGYQRSHALLKSAYDRIPEAAKDHDFGAALDAFTPQDFDTTSYENMADRLTYLIGKLQTEAFAYDEIAAQELENITSQTTEIIKMVEDLKELAAGGSFLQSYDSFTKKLTDCQSRWEQKTLSLEARLLLATTMLKGMETCSAYSKDPVNLSTGNFIYEKTDMEIRGEIPLSFTRFYNAMDVKKSALGRSWVHNYSETIQNFFNLIYIGVDGKEETYVKTEIENIFCGERNKSRKITRLAEGYEYTNGNIKKYFSEAGKLMEIRQLSGGSLHFTYNEEEKLIKACRETGEALYYRYNEAGNLIEVVDHASRSIQLTYEKKRLATVTDPCGRTTCYTYAENNRIKEIINQKGIASVINTYDMYRRCIKQEFPDGGYVIYQYNDDYNEVIQIEQNGRKIIYQHDNRLRLIKTIYEDNSEEYYTYDERNNRTSYTDRLGNITKYQYDDNNSLVCIENPEENFTYYFYDEAFNLIKIKKGGIKQQENTYDIEGRLLQRKNALGNKVMLFYQGNNNSKKIIYPDQSSTLLYYDVKGNILTLIQPDGVRINYEYDELNRVIKTIDGKDNVTQYCYDNNDRIIKTKRADQAERNYIYDVMGNLIEMIDYDGNKIKYYYNSMGNIERIIDKNNRETHYTYDMMWNVIQQIEPNGNQINYRYDKNNNLVEIIEPSGGITLYEYDANGNRVKIIDSMGNKTEVKYDKLNRIKTIINPEGEISQYEYNNNGQLTETINFDGSRRSYKYNSQGMLIQETNEAGEIKQYRYNCLGKLAAIIDGKQRQTIINYEKGGRIKEIQYPDQSKEIYCYDELGNIIEIDNRENDIITYTYDNLGRPITFAKSNGEQYTYEYDILGRVTRVTNQKEYYTTYQYSVEGYLTQVIDAEGNKVSYTYDNKGKILTISQHGEEGIKTTTYYRNQLGQAEIIEDALGQTEYLKYDLLGRIISKQDKDGYLTTYAYNKKGSIKEILYADGKKTVYQYDALNRLQTMKDWLGETKIERDALGRVQKIKDPQENILQYQWNAAGELTAIYYPYGTMAEYSYNQEGCLTTTTINNLQIQYKYDHNNRMIQKIYGNGQATNITYDNQGRLSTLTHKNQEEILDNYKYTYNQFGLKTRITKMRKNLLDESGDYKYKYDMCGRLIKVEKNGELIRKYNFDQYGNRIKKIECKNGNLQIATYQYNELNQLLSIRSEDNQIHYNYDKRGNLTEINRNGICTNRYQYGAINRMEQATDNQGNHASYEYNGLLLRTVKREIKHNQYFNNKKIQHTKVPETNIVYVYDITKARTNLLGEIQQESCTAYVWDNYLTGIVKNNQYYYLFTDEQGSPIRSLDAKQGSLVDTYGYDEYGIDLYRNQGQSQSIGYTGYQYDVLSSSYYAKAREYQPQTGRFHSRDEDQYIDPTIAISLNMYQYCNSNPLNYIDPLGHQCLEEDKLSTKNYSMYSAEYLRIRELSQQWNINDKPVKWKNTDLLYWLTLGGDTFIHNKKLEFIRQYKNVMMDAAKEYDLPPVLVAGVAYCEYGGDPMVLDDIAYALRSLDWCGPEWIDNNLTITKNPKLTSFGNISMQVRRTWESLGYTEEQVTSQLKREMVSSLKDPVQNIYISAKHISDLRDLQYTGKTADEFSEDEFVIIASRYNRGSDISQEALEKDLSYGERIVTNASEINGVLENE